MKTPKKSNKEKEEKLKKEIEKIEDTSKKLKEEAIDIKKEISLLKKEYNKELLNYKEITDKIVFLEKENEKLNKQLGKERYKEIIILSNIPDNLPQIVNNETIKEINSLLTNIPNTSGLYFQTKNELVCLLENAKKDMLDAINEDNNIELRLSSLINLNKKSNLTLINQIITFYQCVKVQLSLYKQISQILIQHHNTSTKKDTLFLQLKEKENLITDQFNLQYKPKSYLSHYLNSITKQYALYTSTKNESTLSEIEDKLKKYKDGKVKYEKPSSANQLNITIKTQYTEASVDDSSIMSSSLISNEVSRNGNLSSFFGKEKQFTFSTTVKKKNISKIENSSLNASSHLSKKDDSYKEEINELKVVRGKRGQVGKEKPKPKATLQFEQNVNNDDCCTSCT